MQIEIKLLINKVQQVTFGFECILDLTLLFVATKQEVTKSCPLP